MPCKLTLQLKYNSIAWWENNLYIYEIEVTVMANLAERWEGAKSSKMGWHCLGGKAGYMHVLLFLSRASTIIARSAWTGQSKVFAGFSSCVVCSIMIFSVLHLQLELFVHMCFSLLCSECPQEPGKKVGPLLVKAAKKAMWPRVTMTGAQKQHCF